MPATVYDNTGATVTGLSLVQFGCADNNAPGLAATYSAGAETCSYATSTGTSAKSSGSSSGSGSGSSKKSGASRPSVGVDFPALAMVGSVLAAFIGGIAIL